MYGNRNVTHYWSSVWITRSVKDCTRMKAIEEVFERNYEDEAANWEEDVVSVLNQVVALKPFENRLEQFLNWKSNL